MARLLAATWLPAMLGCLPHGAMGGGGRDEARAYDIEVSDDQGLACVTRLSLHYAEEFRDQSLGWLACLHPAKADPDPSQCVELRAFPTGEVLELRGLAEWPALARLDLVWPMLSPAIREGAVMTSWPLYAGPFQPARVVASGRWWREGELYGWRATLEANDPSLVLAGEVEARLSVRGGAVQGAEWNARRSACAGDDCVYWTSAGRLRAAGSVPALPTPVVSDRATVLARRQPGATSAALYARLLRGEDSSMPPVCAAASPPAGNLVQSRGEPVP
ncbi:MAG: hypothetical protein FJ102_04825 [Deltaproteobacteria bacterium]|nr:hypothetical protein [Deltaproteobacteria bacterium]